MGYVKKDRRALIRQHVGALGAKAQGEGSKVERVGLRYDDSCRFSVLKDQGLGLRGSRFLWHSHSTPPGEVQGENGRVSGRFKLRLEVRDGLPHP